MSESIPYNQPLLDAHEAALNAKREWMRVAKQLFPIGTPVTVTLAMGYKIDGIVSGLDNEMRIHVDAILTKDSPRVVLNERYTSGEPGRRTMMFYAGEVTKRSAPDAG